MRNAVSEKKEDLCSIVGKFIGDTFYARTAKFSDVYRIIRVHLGTCFFKIETCVQKSV